jgi:hypothetical protein
MHDTSIKGSIAYHKVCADLVSKGYVILNPQNDSLPYDLIAKKGNTYFTIQIKYSTNGNIRNMKRCGSKNRVKYNEEDFDYYAIYNPIVDKCIYPSFKYGGSRIRFEDKKVTGPFYYYEDFLDFTDDAKKRTSTVTSSLQLSLDYEY